MDRLTHGEHTTQLIYTPSFSCLGVSSLPSVLALTDLGWHLLEREHDGALRGSGARHAQTLWFELSNVLLLGRLRIAYAVDGATAHATIEFNTVMNALYVEAIYRLLRAAPDEPVAEDAGLSVSFAQLEALPYKFRSALMDFTPPGEALTALHAWPTTHRRIALWWKREVAPAGVIALTARTLLLVRDETVPAALRRGTARYGKLAHFMVRSGELEAQIAASNGIANMRFRVHRGSDTAALQVDVPRSSEAALRSLLARHCTPVSINA
ncbi:hypothetical protein [Niveibacterium sp.]|uniref:hypothetical protein n=1 Tax=Niveibacterium sp. TaxID=2017444 RepID=UPI0035B32668